MIAIKGGPAGPVIIHTSKARGTELTSSCKEEKAALLLALTWTRAICPTQRIQNGVHDTQHIRQRLDNRKGPTIFIWVPGHKDIPDNEAAAATTNTLKRPILFATAKPSSDEPSPILHPKGPELPWYTKFSP